MSFILKIYYFILSIFSFGLFRPAQRNDSFNNSFSIIIAAKNEEKNINRLLDSLLKLNYPSHLYEIIVANDNSNDRTEAIIRRYADSIKNLHLINISKQSGKLIGKKRALTQAIEIAQKQILVFTDADCEINQNWLCEINRHFTENTDFVAGYKELLYSNTFFSNLKNLENSAFLAVVAGSIGLNIGLSCTASNIAYRKTLFHKVNGFEGIGHIKSGDDDLMLQKMSKQIRNMQFMFSEASIIKSYESKTTEEKIQTETRRGSKWKYYPLWVKMMTLFVFIFYFLVLLKAAKYLKRKKYSKFINLLILRSLPEFFLVGAFLYKLKRTKYLLSFPIAALLYIPYYIFFGLKGTFGKYRWK